MLKKILNNLITLSRNPFIVPFYHLVSDDENTHAKYLYPPRKIEVFKKDLIQLLRYYKPVSLQEFLELPKTVNKDNKPYFHLTFDDGLSNFYDIVVPILEANKISATIFVNTDFIDNKALFYRYKASLLIQVYENSEEEIKDKFHVFFKSNKNIKEALLAVDYKEDKLLDELSIKVGYSFEAFLKNEKPYLTTLQIKDLIKRGFTIGAHSKSHPIYAKLSLEEQLKQTNDSVDFIKDKFNLKYNAFSFPFNDLNVKEEFYQQMQPFLDVSFGTAGIKKDKFPTNFQRISFELADDNIELFLIKEYLKYLLKIVLRKNVMPRK